MEKINRFIFAVCSLQYMQYNIDPQLDNQYLPIPQIFCLKRSLKIYNTAYVNNKKSYKMGVKYSTAGVSMEIYTVKISVS